MIDISNHAFSLLKDIYDLKVEDLSALDPAAVTERVRGIHRGLSAEHEFAAIASWLGKCSLLSQIDDVLHSSAMYRAPDFLVVANYEGREIPFLVEVKSNDADRLKWSEQYLHSLQAFASLMNLPLLVAWKRGKLWTLTDVRLFAKNVTAFHLSFETAMKNNLMSSLFGNEWIALTESFRLELKLRIEDDIDMEAELLPEGRYHMRIEDAGLWGSKGKLDREEGSQLWWFLVAAASDMRSERVKDVFTQQFVVDSESMFSLSDVLVARLLWNKGDVANIDWLAEIRKGLPAPSTDLNAILQMGLDAGAVRYVFRQEPETMPDFLVEPRSDTAN